jgi:hypothetical protein
LRTMEVDAGRQIGFQIKLPDRLAFRIHFARDFILLAGDERVAIVQADRRPR